MNFDIRKDGQIFGPHTVDELKALVASGDVALTDIVIKELGEEVPVGVFLEQSRPLKLKVLAPAVPEPRLTPPVPFPAPRATAPSPAPRTSAKPPAITEPPLLPAGQATRTPPVVRTAAKPDPDEPKPVGNLVWITPLAGVVCVWLNYRKFIVTERHNDFYFFEAMGQMVFCVILCVGIRASRENLRTARATWISVLLGFVLSSLLAISRMMR
jgi:hypothetical protein